MENCVFCKIIKKEIPCYKIYEDDKILAFLDINPATKGHTLIIPKQHYENVNETPENYLTEIIKTCKKIGLLLKEKLNAESYNIINSNGKHAQQDVFHVHFHVVPRYGEDKLIIWQGKTNTRETEQTHKILTS